MENKHNIYYNSIVIDLNNLFWRSMYTCFKKSVDVEQDNIYSGTIQEVLKRVKDLDETFGIADTKIYFLCDNPFSKINERQEISSSYKHARKNKKLPKAFYKTLDVLIEILKIYKNNFYIVRESNLEADDLVPIVIDSLENEMALLVSNDLDWARAITETTHWYDYYKHYTIKTFEEEYGFSPKGKTIQMYKAIHGDISDCVENAVPHLPKNLLLYLIKNYTCIKEMIVDIHNHKNLFNEHWIKIITGADQQLKINYQLVDYVDIKDLNLKDIIFECKENIKMLRWHFNILDIPFEAKMIEKKEGDFSIDFFKKKKYKRAKQH